MNMECLHLLACSSISFSNILQFSMYIYFTSLVRLFLNTVLMLLEIEFLFLIFFLEYSLLVYTVQLICVCWFGVLKICWICLLLLTIFFACILHCILFSINIHMQVKGYKSTHCIDSFLSVSFWYSHSFSRLTISYALSQIYFLAIWAINISFYSCYFVLFFCPLSLFHSNV